MCLLHIALSTLSSREQATCSREACLVGMSDRTEATKGEAGHAGRDPVAESWMMVQKCHFVQVCDLPLMISLMMRRLKSNDEKTHFEVSSLAHDHAVS